MVVLPRGAGSSYLFASEVVKRGCCVLWVPETDKEARQGETRQDRVVAGILVTRLSFLQCHLTVCLPLEERKKVGRVCVCSCM